MCHSDVSPLPRTRLSSQSPSPLHSATPGCTPCLTNPCSTLGLLTLIGSRRPSLPRAPVAFAKRGQKERKSGPRQPLAIHAPGTRMLQMSDGLKSEIGQDSALRASKAGWNGKQLKA
ncbi:hypothetical protein AOLI_G00231100 [Acnodon oligacanthus]